MPPDLGRELAQHLLPNPPKAIGIAVSGGSDSVGLLYLMHDFAQIHGTHLHVITVDHSLRPEAEQEIAFVAQLCEGLGVPHSVARWTGWTKQGNLQNEARLARYHLISEWARARELQTVVLGHTLDDQAETVLMRLTRGAGVDGLTAMTPRRTSNGIVWVRPMLSISRKDLQNNLSLRNVTWCDDPSNEDMRFDRVKVRRALEVLEPLGLNATALGQVASNMARARDALSWQAFLAAKSMVTIERGAVRIDWRSYVILPDETARRILVGAIGWISGAGYPPRRKAIMGLIQALKQGVSATADGCHVLRRNDTLWVFRELNPVRDHTCSIDDIWDGRWRIQGGASRADADIRVLGVDGLEQVSNWRALNVPRDVLISCPALWHGDELLSAPLAGFGNGWHAQLEISEEALFAALLSH